MALEGDWDDPKYTGFSKYFNGYTIRGRSNWAKLWISVYALTYLTYRIIKKRPSNSEETTVPQVLSLSDSSNSCNRPIIENSQEVEKPHIVQDPSVAEEKLDSSTMQNLHPDPRCNPGLGMNEPFPPQQPCYPPPPCYPCYPYFFPPPPFPGPNQFPFYPVCPYPHYPYAAQPPHTPPNSPDHSFPSSRQTESNTAFHAPPYQTSPNCENQNPSCNQHHAKSNNGNNTNNNENNDLHSETSSEIPIEPAPSSHHGVNSNCYASPEFLNQKKNS